MIKVTNDRGNIDLHVEGRGEQLLSELLMINHEVLRGMMENFSSEVSAAFLTVFLKAINTPDIWLSDEPEARLAELLRR